MPAGKYTSLRLTVPTCKMDGQETFILSFWEDAYFQGRLLLVSGRVNQTSMTLDPQTHTKKNNFSGGIWMSRDCIQIPWKYLFPKSIQFFRRIHLSPAHGVGGGRAPVPLQADRVPHNGNLPSWRFRWMSNIGESFRKLSLSVQKSGGVFKYY